jgi:hypothetical protein
MNFSNMKAKKCKHCKQPFTPMRTSLEKYCWKPECVEAFVQEAREKQWKKRKKQMKESSLTLSDYMKLLQQVFNTYIRLRDDGKMCISCGNMTAKRDAGHFFSVGNYPSVRFHEDNVHSQCVHCNQYRGGNLHEYRRWLILRIGQERFNELEKLAHQSNKYSIPEIKELIKIYKNKINDLRLNK